MDLSEIRVQIDRVDNEILKAFKERMELSRLVAESKRASGTPIRNSQRENQVLDRVSADAGEFSPYVRRLWRTLFDLSSSYQSLILNESGTCTPSSESETKELSFIVQLEHRPGAIYEVISRFAAMDINIAELERSPNRSDPEHSSFLFKLEADPNAPEICALLDGLRRDYPGFELINQK